MLVLAVAPTLLLPAQVITFTNYSPTGATLNWNTAANWSPNTVPNGVGVTANFNQVSNGIPLGVNISWGANAIVGNLWSTNSSSFVVAGGSTLTLAVDGVTQTIPTINVGSSSSECWIKGGYLAGTNGFLKAGANKLTFRYDANTNAGLFGPVIIGQGALGFQVDGNLGDPHNSLTFSNGITFTLESGTTGASVALAPTRSVHLASASSAANITALSGQTLAISGVIDEIAAGSKLTWNGSGANLELSGSNTYSGATTISAGTLTINGAGQLGGGNYPGAIANSGVLNCNSSAAQILSGVVSGSGPLSKNGSGTLTLSAANTYTGATIVSNGIFTLNGAISNANVTVAGGTFNGTGWLGYNLATNKPDTLKLLSGALNISNLVLRCTGAPALRNYTLVDYSAGGTLTTSGTTNYFAGITNQPSGYKLVLDATARKLYMLIPPGGTALFLR